MLPAGVRPFPQLRQRDPLALPLTDQVALELREGSHHAQQQMRHGRVFPGKGQVLLFKTDVDTALREAEDYLAQIVQVPSESIHGVADDRIAFPNVVDELVELRALKILARSLIDKSLIEGEAFKLAKLLLIEGADTEVADELTSSPIPFCRVRF